MIDVLIILALLLLNGFFALSELSIASSRKARLQVMQNEGRRGARTALRLAARPDEFLSAVQVGITLVGILSGAFGASAFSGDLAVVIERVPIMSGYGDEVATVIIVTVLTYFSVVLGELIPKQLALGNPEKFACLAAPIVSMLVVAARPVVWLLSRSSAPIARLLGSGNESGKGVTEAEVSEVMRQATHSGSIHASEQQIASRVLRFADRTVREMMTPRVDLHFVRLDDGPAAIRDAVLRSPHSHLPVCHSRVDDLAGILKVRELLEDCSGNPLPHDQASWRSLLLKHARPPVVVLERATGADALERMRRERTHFAVVVDEYGGTAGVVTIHDLLEALVGYLPDAQSGEDPLVRRADGSIIAAGWVPVSELYSTVGVEAGKDEHSETIAARILRLASDTPAVGSKVHDGEFEYEVLDLDGRVIDKVLATRLGPPDGSSRP